MQKGVGDLPADLCAARKKETKGDEQPFSVDEYTRDASVHVAKILWSPIGSPGIIVIGKEKQKRKEAVLT